MRPFAGLSAPARCLVALLCLAATGMPSLTHANDKAVATIGGKSLTEADS